MVFASFVPPNGGVYRATRKFDGEAGSSNDGGLILSHLPPAGRARAVAAGAACARM